MSEQGTAPDRPTESQIDDLIEASSFGTPGAKALRDSVSPETVRKLTERARQTKEARGDPA